MRKPSLPGSASPLADQALSGLEKIVILLRQHTGNDFSQSSGRRSTAAIERRIGLHQLDGIADYLRCSAKAPQERNLLFKELLIGVTSFFRDPPAWTLLRERVFPDLFAERPTAANSEPGWPDARPARKPTRSPSASARRSLRRPRGSLHAARLRHRPRSRRDRPSARRPLPLNIVADVTPSATAPVFVLEESRGYRIRKKSARWSRSPRRT